MALHDFPPSSNFIRETNSRKIRWAGHVTRMEYERSVTGRGMTTVET
jgi:hypothetical protein